MTLFVLLGLGWGYILVEIVGSNPLVLYILILISCPSLTLPISFLPAIIAKSYQ